MFTIFSSFADLQVYPHNYMASHVDSSLGISSSASVSQMYVISYISPNEACNHPCVIYSNKATHWHPYKSMKYQNRTDNMKT